MPSTNTPPPLSIGALAAHSGCSVPTIRYYEQIGLVPAARRRDSGHRVYDASAVALLGFIRRCRDFGFPLEQVRELVALSHSQERDCGETLAIAEAHLQAVRAKLADLQALERELAHFARGCAERCAGGPAAQCSIVSEISAPARPARGCCG